MKKIYFLFLSIFMTTSVFAQSAKQMVGSQKNLRASQKTSLHEKEIASYKAIAHYNTPETEPVIRSRAAGETIIGTTQYDLQSNSSTQNRIVRNADGTMSAAWTMSADGSDGSWNDRGSGYVHHDGNDWGAAPSGRLEQVRRTGWPSLNTLPNGNDIILSHFSPGPYDVNMLRQGNDGSWTEKAVGAMADPGVLWPRSTVGGPDGNTVHAIALTLPTGLDGAPYKGMDGHLLYYRSLDGGDTFDKMDVVLPGVDSSNYTSIGGDDYAIHARGNDVAVLVMAAWGDVKLLKSSDNGDTWTEHIVYDFPLGPAYDIRSGYDTTMIPIDTLTDNGIGVRSTDGAGSVLIDHDGMAHVWYTEIWVSDDNFNDDTWSFFPGINSINYWNESMGDGNFTETVSYVDADGNGTFDVDNIIDEIGSYGQGLASYPSTGIDSDGNLYLVYSAVVETYFNEEANPGKQHFRHLYISSSQDNGVSWSDPIDIINPDFADADFFSFYECVFPTMAKNVDGNMHIIYQQDYEPGHSVSGDEDDVVNNNIVYLQVPDDYQGFGTINTKVVNPETFNFAVSPNPAQERLNLSFDLENSGNVSFELYNTIGQKVVTFASEFFTTGTHSKTLDLNNIAKGTYLLKLQTEDKISSRLVVIE